MFEQILAAFRALWRADMTETERAAALDKRAVGLEWRTSDVDLLKVLGMDSSLKARHALAKDLGYALEFTGSAADNRWLHHRILEQVARHGIKIP
jgi:hypothetical protein